MDLKIVLEIIERPWFKYFVLGLVVGVIFGAGLTYTAVNLLIIQQRESTIQDLRYDLSTEGLVRKNIDDRIVRLSGTIVQQNEEIKRLEATQCPNGSGIICKQPMAIIWEIGYDDGRYEEFDPLPEFPGRFPWEYKEGESFDRFPKEINDGRRTPIRIKFSLNDTQLKNNCNYSA